MTEASAISESDYIVIDSPTKGTRKYLAANLAGGGGGDTPWNSIYISSNQDTAGSALSSDGWYTQSGSNAPVLNVSNTTNLTMYGKTKFEIHLHIKTPVTLPNSTTYLLGGGSMLCSNFISLNSNGTLTFTAKNINYTTTAALSADTEYIIDFVVDVTNTTISYSITLTDETVVEANSYTQAVSYDNYTTNWHIFSTNGSNKTEGALYLPESYIKVDDILIWGTA
jgi:hypothetical protein